MNAISLPSDIYFFLSSFLCRKDWNGFLNSTKRLEFFKRLTRSLVLTAANSKRYISDEFGALVNSKIHDPRRQLSLTLVGISDRDLLAKAQGVLRLTIARSDVEIADESLTNAHHLTMIFCPQLKEIHCAPDMRVLEIYSCKSFAHIHNLRNLVSVTIADNDVIRDVSLLKHVQSLKLLQCSQVEDLSSLGGLRTVVLVGCRKISDVSPLRTVSGRVEINSCPALLSIRPLLSVPEVIVEHCEKITESERAAFRDHPSFQFQAWKE